MLNTQRSLFRLKIYIYTEALFLVLMNLSAPDLWRNYTGFLP